MKKSVPSMLLAAVAALVLVGCGGGDPVPAVVADTPTARLAMKSASGATQLEGPNFTASWVELPNPNYAPPKGPYARVWTEMTWDSLRQEMVIFGGIGADGYQNDIWAYSSVTNNWTNIDPQVFCPGNSGFSKPNGTDDTAFRYDPVNNLYWVFGAPSGYRCLSYATPRTAAAGTTAQRVVDPSLTGAAASDYVSWRVRAGSSDVEVSAYDPAAKALTLAAPIASLGPGSSFQLYATTGTGFWYFDPVNRTWTGQDTPPNRVTTPSGARVAPAVAWSDADKAFVLFAGKLSGGPDRSVWRLDALTRAWTQLPLPSTTPPHMRELLNSMVYDKANDVFILFGGICAYDASCPEGSRSGQTWAYKLSTNTWKNMAPAVSPGPRAQHVMAYDEANGVVVLFGGATNDGIGDDTWIYHYASNTWKRLMPPMSPDGRYLAQITYDPVNARTVMFGGQASSMRADIWALRLTPLPPTAAPQVHLLTPASGAGLLAPAQLSLTASAEDSDGNVVKVEYYSGQTKIGEAATAPYTFVWNDVGAGSYRITAVATDDVGARTVSQPVTVTVAAGNAPPTVSITAPRSGTTVAIPATLTLEALASDPDGTVSKVEFFEGATKIGEAVAAPWRINWSTTAAGSYTLSAVATDNLGLKTTSASVVITASAVNSPPTVSVTSPVPGAVSYVPGSFALAAQASDADGSVARVEFYVGGTRVATVTSAPYTYVLEGLVAGDYVISAVAVDNLGATTTSAAVGVRVEAGGTGVNVALASNGAVASASSMYSSSYPAASIIDGNRKGNAWGAGGGWNDATWNEFPDWVQVRFAQARSISRIDVFTLADSFGADPTPSLTFTQFGIRNFEVQYHDGAQWRAVPGGQVSNNNFVWRSFSFPSLTTDRVRVVVSSALATYSRIVEVEAWAVGGGGNQPPSVTLSSPASGSTFVAPASVALTASASDSDGGVAKVEYFAGTTRIGESSVAPFSVAWTGVAAGVYSITAVATDNLGAKTTSVPVSITVSAPANQAPSVFLTAPSPGSTWEAPASVTVAATASDSDGSIARVEFFSGTTKIGERQAAPYTIQWSNVGAGSYTLTAVATDNSGATTTSVPLTITVSAPANQPPSVALVAPVAGSSWTAPASITLTATASDGDGNVTRVEFYSGSTKIGERLAAPYTLQWADVPAGSYTLTAVATDNLGASSVSAAVAVSVAPAGGSVNVAASANGGRATASSVYSTLYPVASVIDGNRSGAGWGSGGGWNDANWGQYPDWVQVAFSEPRLINRVDVFTLADDFSATPTPTLTFSKFGVTAFEVQAWIGGSWITVPGGEVGGNNRVWRTITFPPVTTDRIRVVVNASLAQYSRIVEIEAWTVS